MSYIYKITNRVNGMSYVGNTAYDIRKRWKEHCKDSRTDRCSNRPLYSAINKYGPNNFEISVIEECDQDVAPEREKYWIEKYNTYANGYNDTMGGNGKPQIDHDLLIATYKKTKSQKKTAQTLNICESSVQKILNIEHVKKYPKELTYREYLRPISMYASDGQCVMSFPSVSAAARWIVEQDETIPWVRAEVYIRRAASGQRQTAFNYRWKYKRKKRRTPQKHQ